MAELERLNREEITLVIITHDQAVAARAGRVLTIKDGTITETRGRA
jgi:ABC-type lipoprotein export system ATPase subunit